MIWTIIQQYQIADISEEGLVFFCFQSLIVVRGASRVRSRVELTAKEALLLWCQKKTKGYRDVDPPGIKNFTTRFASCVAFRVCRDAVKPRALAVPQLVRRSRAVRADSQAPTGSA